MPNWFVKTIPILIQFKALFHHHELHYFVWQYFPYYLKKKISWYWLHFLSKSKAVSGKVRCVPLKESFTKVPLLQCFLNSSKLQFKEKLSLWGFLSLRHRQHFVKPLTKAEQWTHILWYIVNVKEQLVNRRPDLFSACQPCKGVLLVKLQCKLCPSLNLNGKRIKQMGVLMCYSSHSVHSLLSPHILMSRLEVANICQP